MPRKPKAKPIQCKYFLWRLFQREGVWYADGRTNQPNVGKHSLATRDRDEALNNLHRLDKKLALREGLINADESVESEHITLSRGWAMYLTHAGRPDVLGGASEGTLKRYRAVCEKHLRHCQTHGLEYWHQIGKQQVENYGRWLSREGYADRTLFLELTLLKSVIGWLIEEKHLPESCRFKLSLRRPQGTDTYCYSQEEVLAMIEHCQENSQLEWLADVLVALACTGLRISELSSLRWSDIDREACVIRLTDERSSNKRKRLGTVRKTKGRRSRTLPIHPDLRKVLDRLTPHKDGRLFHGPRGGKLKPDTVRTMLIRDVIQPLKERFPTPESEIGFEHGRVHSFRHFFVSQAFLSGVAEGEIMEWVGHQDSKMVAHYRHLRDEDSQRSMEQINFFGERNSQSSGSTDED